MNVPHVSIHYRRLPDRDQVFRQALLDDTGECLVTLLEAAPLEHPVHVAGAPVLDPGAPAVWFTFPGRWYDVGLFHRADGRCTGAYANILTPVRVQGRDWYTTDLCLDVWAGMDGRVEILDEAEFTTAVDRGWIDAPTADHARETAEYLAASARQGGWPPEPVPTWDLARARQRLRDLRATAGPRGP